MDTTKIADFIKRGNEIANVNKQQRLSTAQQGRHNSGLISGREYAQWMSEIKMFIERHLKGHPLYRTMNDAYFFRDSKKTAFDDMMGCLQTLLDDEEAIGTEVVKSSSPATKNVSSLENLLAQDILLCTDYLQNPQEREDDGRKLYARITARYDSVIKDFGNGLYEYIPATHFYDLEADIITINDNLNMLVEKMTVYQAIHFGNTSSIGGGKAVISNNNIPSIEEMLAEDILLCADYLKNPVQEDIGRNLYTRITARYDGMIKDFGNGLYSYISEQHFYDPDVGISTINHNLNILLQKMTTYQATQYGRKLIPEGSKRVLSNKKVFIVHGHDEAAKSETARVVEKLGLTAIILHEQASSGNTIIEKIEKYSDVGFAIVLYTPCDEGHSKKEEALRDRARQNVVFEHGYLIGKLGRDRVCALVKGTIETPGDISGVVYEAIDNGGAWKYKLVDEMNAVGFQLNKNQL